MAAAGKEYKLAVKIAGSVSSSFNNAMGTAETKMQSLGSIAAKAAAVAAAAWGALEIGQFVGDAVSTYADFDQAMANTAAICGATADDYASSKRHWIWARPPRKLPQRVQRPSVT